MRAGLVGAGRIGAVHAQTLRDDPEVEEVVVADLDPDRARSAAGELGAAHATLDELWDGRVDAVVIAASTTAHAELVHRAADAGLAVFCEKPLASDVAGTRAVIDHVASAGVSLQVGFQRRFDAGYRAAREAVRDGRLGVLHTIRATTADRVPPPDAYLATSGGLFRDALIHDFDVIRFVTGRDVERVWATGSDKGASVFAETGDVHTATVVLTLDDGTLATVSGSRYNGAGYDVRMEAVGSEGTLAVGLDDRTPVESAEPGVAWPGGAPYATFQDRFGGAYRTEMAEWVQHVLGRIPNRCPPADALEALYVAEAAQLSREERRPVEMEEVRS
jgi:myo-inositol 2-dehydrogenase/D-chiro-inositol 1-dehydrogenase